MAITGGRTGYPHVEDGEPVPWVGQRMTLEEFLDLPEVKPYLEYDDGVVRQKMPPSYAHITIQVLLTNVMNEAAKPSRRGIGRPEWRFVTSEWSPTPDVSFYRRGRVKLQNGEPPIRMLESPDIAIEIISPGEPASEQISKCLHYLRLQTTISLLIDPYRKVVFAFTRDKPPVEMHGDDRIDLGDLLPEFALRVRELFDPVYDDLKYLEGDEDEAAGPERE